MGTAARLHAETVARLCKPAHIEPCLQEPANAVLYLQKGRVRLTVALARHQQIVSGAASKGR
jgi:hypothetical protein